MLDETKQKDETIIFYRKEETEQIIAKIKNEAYKKLFELINEKKIDLYAYSGEKYKNRIVSAVNEILDKMNIPGIVERPKILKAILDETAGLGPLEDLLKDNSISEIMVNGINDIYIEKNGKIERSSKKFISEAQILSVIEKIVVPLGRRIDESSPMVDARLADGSRVNAIIPPLSLKGPILTIRKFSQKLLSTEDLIKLSALDQKMAQFLKACVENRCNILISGGTGSGKTTLLNVFSSFIPENERIITIEDSAELKLSQEHVVSLESRQPNIEGKGQVSIRDLVKNSLRMRPDRIIIGEVRSGESIDMLQAMNTGHDGSLTTIHSNSCRDAVSRLETMVLMSGVELPMKAIRDQIVSAIDIIVHQQRFPDGSRKITSISEITGIEGDRITMQEIFCFNETGADSSGRIKGSFVPTGNIPSFIEKWRGISSEARMDFFRPN